jgi:acyl-CoA hydrolase
MTELVLPSHANAIGTAFGGAILSWIDVCAAIAAQRHCGAVAVTASIDEMQFLAPVHVGDVVTLTARVNAAFTTSVEVECRVEREGTASSERTLCADALLTFVCRGDDGAPAVAPVLALETEDDRVRQAEAVRRRHERLARRRVRR